MGLFDDPFGFKEEKREKKRGFDTLRQAQIQARDEKLRKQTPIHEFVYTEIPIDISAPDFSMKIYSTASGPYLIQQRSNNIFDIFDVNKDQAYLGHILYNNHFTRRVYRVYPKNHPGFEVSDRIGSMGWILENTGTRKNISFIVYDMHNNLVAAVGSWLHDGTYKYIRTYKSGVEISIFGILFAKMWEKAIRQTIIKDD